MLCPYPRLLYTDCAKFRKGCTASGQPCNRRHHFISFQKPFFALSVFINPHKGPKLLWFLAGIISGVAFGVILIGLIPSLDAMRRLVSMNPTEHLDLGARSALCIPIEQFEYLRHGEPPNANLQNNIDIHFPTTTYIRVPSHESYTPLLPITCMWNGEIVRYNEKVIVLKDENNLGDAVMWWKAAKRGKKIIRNLEGVRLAHPKRIVRALELIAEMAMIGDSILHYYETALKEYAKSDQIRDAVHTTPSSVYSRILGAIGLLDEWGIVDDAKKERFIWEDFSELRRGDKYGMLFFILLNTSSFFDSRKEEEDDFPRTTASDVTKIFMESNEDITRKSITEKWLSHYYWDPESPFKNQDEDEGASLTYIDATPAQILTGSQRHAAYRSARAFSCANPRLCSRRDHRRQVHGRNRSAAHMILKHRPANNARELYIARFILRRISMPMLVRSRVEEGQIMYVEVPRFMELRRRRGVSYQSLLVAKHDSDHFRPLLSFRLCSVWVKDDRN
ncbi:unnamed protein product [Chondrus crispus]|uniref:Uncharacterized protein n=1 Tax=Chondrus crispus TaxID=2769 RepID=R7Q2R8_CHOCR|nr:unnamed protein product [Chondrus crispus]CDF32183.1 unnamed protein product [Chondrus crispus]|eukprot:XP_005711848.1 unnamed protein product [Chondrus crispus]